MTEEIQKVRDSKEDNSFAIRLEARLKNDALISAREKLGWAQKYVAQAMGISEGVYGKIERMEHYPSVKTQETILDFYNDHGIALNQAEVFPAELKETKFGGKIIMKDKVSPQRLISLSALDKKLLAPVEIDDVNIKQEDLKTVVNQAIEELRLIRGSFEVDVIKMTFGLDPYERPHKVEEIAKKYCVTKQAIYHHQKLGIRNLRHAKISRKLRPFLG